jgi:hypothetical protein
MDVSKTSSFRTPAVGRGETNNVFAGRNGEVFRRTGAGWERPAAAGQGQRWSTYDRTPEAADRYQISREARRSEGGFGRSDAGLERDFGARSRGFGRASAFRGGGGGGFHGGGGGGGGFHGGGGHR